MDYALYTMYFIYIYIYIYIYIQYRPRLRREDANTLAQAEQGGAGKKELNKRPCGSVGIIGLI
jgi:hypothetical protein